MEQVSVNIDERRLELLKKEGMGFSRSEIVNDLAVKYHTSKRNIRHDFYVRKSWQPHIQMVDCLLVIKNRYEYIYREAAFIYFNAKNENAKLGALNTMLNVVRSLHETMPVDVDKPTEIKIVFEDQPFPWKNDPPRPVSSNKLSETVYREDSHFVSQDGL